MIENVLTRLLFKYAGPEFGLFLDAARLTGSYPISLDRDAAYVGRPGGAVGFVGAHYHKAHPNDDHAEHIDFADSEPDCYELDPDHPWRVQIRGELVELFDLILEKPMTELLFTCDPTGAEIEKELKHLRRFDP